MIYIPVEGFVDYETLKERMNGRSLRSPEPAPRLAPEWQDCEADLPEEQCHTCVKCREREENY